MYSPCRTLISNVLYNVYINGYHIPVYERKEVETTKEDFEDLFGDKYEYDILRDTLAFEFMISGPAVHQSHQADVLKALQEPWQEVIDGVY